MGEAGVVVSKKSGLVFLAQTSLLHHELTQPTSLLFFQPLNHTYNKESHLSITANL